MQLTEDQSTSERSKIGNKGEELDVTFLKGKTSSLKTVSLLTKNSLE